ncbi:hypothetical protein [Sinorhizobium sp. BG8]|uniref:phage late control D family protein n=1 Tax=Sinorhizobium sp. BG8 TaxID=2613773 RepID=UPI00193E9CBC|nr:hypothetical protein [Sinorhizobium sp. BG8]QRM54372.1 hypothetical protein F3Y30_07285 [Sinorhizobium sp. BG8]
MRLLPSFFLVEIAKAPLPRLLIEALSSIEVETAVGRASMVRLSFDLSRDFLGDYDAVALPIFRPNTPLTIRLALGLPIPFALVNAYVTEARLLGSNDPGRSILEVVAADALGTLLGQRRAPKTWPNCPDSVVAAAIFASYGIIPDVIPTPPQRTMLDTTTTQRSSDSVYLAQLAGRNGYDLFIAPEPLSGRDMGHFRPPLTLPVPQGVLSIDFGRQTNLRSFNAYNDMQRPTSMQGFTSEPKTRAPLPYRAPIATEMPMGAEPSLLRILPPPVDRMAATDAASPQEAQSAAMAHATASSRAVNCSGEIDGIKFARALRCGETVLVRGAGRENSGLYYVDSVTHRISRDDYAQSFTGWRNAVGLTGAEIFIDPFAAIA